MSAERAPSALGLGLTATASTVGAAGTLVAGIWIGLVGIGLAVGGVYRQSRKLLGFGVLALFVAVIAASVLGASAWLLVPAMAGTVLAWDVGENAITVAEQFPGEATTWRGETLHATVSATVVGLFATGVLVAGAASTNSYPLAAVGLFIAGAFVVLVGLGR